MGSLRIIHEVVICQKFRPRTESTSKVVPRSGYHTQHSLTKAEIYGQPCPKMPLKQDLLDSRKSEQ